MTITPAIPVQSGAESVLEAARMQLGPAGTGTLAAKPIDGNRSCRES